MDLMGCTLVGEEIGTPLKEDLLASRKVVFEAKMEAMVAIFYFFFPREIQKVFSRLMNASVRRQGGNEFIWKKMRKYQEKIAF